MAQTEWRNEPGGGVVQAGEFEFTLRNGFEPGTGYIRLGARAFEELDAGGSATITVAFADSTPATTLTIKDLCVTDYTRKTDRSGNTIYTVRLSDRRGRWKRFGEVSIYANYQKADGSLDPASLNAGMPYTWRELVLACIAAMGESGNIENPDSLPKNPILPRNVRWAGRNAADALRELLEPAGCTVALHFDGKLQILRKGEALPRTISTCYGPNRQTGKVFNLVPDAVQVVGAPVVNETSVELEPCALDTDGEVKALSCISYLQGLEVGRELATDFASLAASPASQAAARLSVGHYFRIPATGRYADENDGRNGALVPVLLGHEGGAGLRLQGTYFEPDDKRRYRNIGGEGALEPFTKGFSVIDPARGLVYTQKVCGTLNNTDVDVLPCLTEDGSVKIEIVSPKLTFRHHLREPYGSLKHCRFTFGEGGAVETIRRPDMKLLCRNGVPDPAALADLQARAQELADARLSVQAALAVETGTYAGALPLKCDGVMECVTWSADHARGITSYSFGPPCQPAPEGREVFFESLVALPAQAAAVPPGRELRLVNANKHGPLVIRSSDARRASLAQDKRRDDTEDNLFAELDEFDEEHQEPRLVNLAPPERHNWRCRDHSPSPNPEPDSQDRAWAVQLVSDDKYMIETALNRSTEVLRLCDENRGDLDDIWRVRSVPSAADVEADMEQRDDSTRVKIISTHQAFRLMWLIDTAIGGEGGWITDVPPEGLGLGAPTDEKAVSPPRRIGQIGNIVVLTDDDEIAVTRDGDVFTYANIRHDAHFHKTESKDGRLHLTDSEPGDRPAEGTKIVGELVCDPSVKNTDTALGKESGQWCPQLVLSGSAIDTLPDSGEIYTNPPVAMPLSPLTYADLDTDIADAVTADANKANELVVLTNALFYSYTGGSGF